LTENLLEATDLAGYGAREGALFVTEQLALEQVLGDRGAIDRDERARRVRAVHVDGAGDDLLARPRLPLDEHGGGAPRDPGQQLVHVQHGGTLADQRVRADRVRLDEGERDRGFAGHGAEPLERAHQLVASQRQGEDVEHT